MDQVALTRLSLMGHPLRIALLRLLVRQLPSPLGAGAIAQCLGVPASTLSAHLAALTEVGVLSLRRVGPARLYHAVPDALGDAMAWLGQDVLLGRAGAVVPGRSGIPRILFLCSDNAALSVLAAALATPVLAGRALVESAGVHPGRNRDTLLRAMLAARGLDPGGGAPEPPRGAADLVIALTQEAAMALPVFADPVPVCGFWPMPLLPKGDALIPRATALHGAMRALNPRIAALRCLRLGHLPRAALQAALDDLSSGLPEAGRAVVSVPEHHQRSACPVPPALAASG